MAPTTPTRGSSWLFRVTAAGCLVAAGGLGWYAAHHVNLARDLRLGLAEATARIELSERNAAMSRQVLEDARAQATILTALDLSSVMLEAQPGARDAKGRAFWSPTRGVVLAVSNIPPISSDRVYQLWFVTPPNPGECRAAPRGRRRPNLRNDRGTRGIVSTGRHRRDDRTERWRRQSHWRGAAPGPHRPLRSVRTHT